MSGITDEQQKILTKALAALKTLGQGIVSAESKESLIKPFFQVLTDYQKNKTDFIRGSRVKHLVRKTKIAAPASPTTAVAAPKAKAKETPDPDLTILENIKALIPDPKNAKSLREQLRGKIVSDVHGRWGEALSFTEEQIQRTNSAWTDLLALVNCVSPEPVVVVASPVESKLISAPVSTEGDEEMARRLDEEEKRAARERQARSEDEKVVPPPRPQREEQLISSENYFEDEFDPARQPPLVGSGMVLLSAFVALVENSQLDEARQASLPAEQVRQAALVRQPKEEKIAEQQAILDSLNLRVVAEEKQYQSEPQISSQETRHPDPKNHSWWYWPALILLSAFASACIIALVFGIIALATNAAFWIVPAAVAGPLTLLAGSVLLLLFVLALHYRFSSSKSLGSGSGEPLLLTRGSRSDARPASLSASVVDRRVPSAGPGHPESATPEPVLRRE